MEPINRRDLFANGLRWLLRLPAHWNGHDEERERAFLRPPGALPETELLAKCTTCGDCVVACQYEAIRLLDHTAGRFQGTPAVLPRQQPCLYCIDFPCIAACNEGALTRDDTRMGTAVVREDRCLVQHGAWCDECVQKCPIGKQAIHFEAGFRLVVDDEHCVGCGVCEYVCPTTPPAITVRPFRKQAQGKSVEVD